MIVVRTVAHLRAALRDRRTGSIGLVPTMGALHEGHVSLLRAARADNDTLVLSIFVNPAQFDEQSDLAAYPRTEEADLAIAENAGVDVVFAPDVAEVYPPGFSTVVSVTGPVAGTLEGAQRGRAHFDGVATVVTKLLLAVLPDQAYFGAKDAQQVAVIRRLVADLSIPVRVVVGRTSRDDDGLARSSRNTRLSAEERARALAIPRALSAVTDAAAAGVIDAEALRAEATAVLAEAGVEPEYVALVDPESFEPVAAREGPVLMAIAARVGRTRLIDNVRLEPAVQPARSTSEGGA